LILQALTQHYETLLKQEKIAPRYYAQASVSLGVRLARNGSITELVSLSEIVQKNGANLKYPLHLDLPEAVVRSSGIASNFLWDNATYILGIDTKGNPTRACECFRCAKKRHLSILEGVENETATSICAFFQNWQPEKALSNSIVLERLMELTGPNNLVFLGRNCNYAFEEPLIREAWENYREKHSNRHRATCLVTGRPSQSIATIHPKIKGIRNAQAPGTSLVSANASAFESYGFIANLNSCVSEYAAFAYSSALNYLIVDFEHLISLNGDTIIYWAENGDSNYQDIFRDCVSPRTGIEENVSHILKHITADISHSPTLFSADMPFYVLCLSPNAGRLSVRFFLKKSFGEIINNLATHYQQLEIAKTPKEGNYLSLYFLLQETILPGEAVNASSLLLASATLQAIILGTCYPKPLYHSILLRIHADRIINRSRAGIIKAYLLRNNMKLKNKEVLTVALNEHSFNKPYVLGRLFSLIEQIQESATPGIKPTIANRYFNSASTTPRLAFPLILKLNQHNLESNGKLGWRYESQISDLESRLGVDDDPYPSRLTLEEQGLFILGYYHQKLAQYQNPSEPKKRNI